MNEKLFDAFMKEGLNRNNKIEKMKHEIYISRNKVSLRGIWAWLFIGLCILKFITLILWSISALLKMIILFI